MKYRSNSILAFIPQNTKGQRILKQTLLIQRALEMRVFVLNILKTSSSVSKIFSSKKAEIDMTRAKEDFKNFIESTISKELTDEVILRVKKGDIVNTLINESIKGGYEFMVLNKCKGAPCSLPKNGLDKIISKSHCPVLSLNSDYPLHRLSKIVIPIDISQRTKKRLMWASLFAKKFGAKIKIVSALNIDIEETKSLAYRNAERIKGMLLDRGIESDVKVLKVKGQSKYRAVLDYIEEEKPELVIIRTHQEYMFSGKKIGKFVSEIVHGCKMPVFTVGGPTTDMPVDFK